MTTKNAPANNTGTNTPAPMTKVEEVRHLLDKMGPALAKGLPKHLDAQRFARIALTSVQRNPILLECTTKSLLGSILEAGQLGLELDGVLGHAYLVPYRIKGVRIAQLQVGYKGIIALAMRSGLVSTITANLVYEGDEFEFAFGTDERLHHIPKWMRTEDGQRTPITHGYAYAKMRDGGVAWTVMTAEEIEAIRRKSKAKDDGPWVEYYGEMAKKTVIRRLGKLLYLSPEFQRGVALDELGDAGVLPSEDIVDITDAAQERIEEIKQTQGAEEAQA